MECEEASIQVPDAATIAREAVQRIPGHAIPARWVQAGAVEGEQFRTATSCQLLYPVSERLTLVRRCAFKELKQKTGGVAKRRSLPEDTEAVMCGAVWVLAILAIFTITVGVDGLHAAADTCEVRVEAVWEVLVAGV